MARPKAGGADVATRRPTGRAPLRWLKPGVLAGAAVPFVLVTLRAIQGTLGADPIAVILNQLGLSALVLLIASLACTPARKLFGWTWPIRIRRELGLAAVFYASTHFLTYLTLDQGLSAGAIIADIVKRPFVTAGFVAWLLLLPLAFTSTRASIQRLGYRRWQRLHQLTYVAGGLAVLHFVWRVKLDVTQPLLYGAVLAALLAVRLIYWQRGRAHGR